MVSNYSTDKIKHASFYDLPKFLNRGDLIVINTSRTRNSAVMATRADGSLLELHLSTHLEDDVWTVEVRSLNELGKSKHLDDAQVGEILSLPDGASATLLGPYISDCIENSPPSETVWQATVNLPIPLGRLSCAAWISDPLQLCQREMASAVLSNRVCHRDRQRGDAVCWAAVHA